MKSSIATALAGLLLATSSVVMASTKAARPTPAKITSADLAGLPLQGKPINPGDKGVKLLVLEFWASWCGPCRESLPHSQQLQKKYRKKGVRFLGISADDDVKAARSFLDDVKFDFPAILDKDRKLAQKLKLDSIPTIVMVAPDGRVVGMERGFTNATKAKLASKVDRALARARSKRR